MGDVGGLNWREDRTPSGLRDAELRRRISLAVWRALANPAFAQALLADPAMLLAGAGCTPQQRLRLERLRAPTVKDFARQAEAAFWTMPRRVDPEPGQIPRAVGQ